jgi:hypothetical protein
MPPTTFVPPPPPPSTQFPWLHPQQVFDYMYMCVCVINEWISKLQSMQMRIDLYANVDVDCFVCECGCMC